MTISFIITTYNVVPYIRKCLESVANCAVDGDEVIIVDDCSNDGTVQAIQAFSNASKFASGVSLQIINLGTNTFGGVGCAANIGINSASCDTIFFVDGDDWLERDAFLEARRNYEEQPCDFMMVNYLEHDEENNLIKRPADAARWSRVRTNAPIDEVRLQALAFVAVPFRKFYSRSFIETHGLRFPEGDFFFEDNPFHWRVCMAAETIRFLNIAVCYHRMNRPGQTMQSTGHELIAFFTHYETILRDIPRNRPEYRFAAARWLLSNMAWHLERLDPIAQLPYFKRGATALSQIDQKTWDEFAERNWFEERFWQIVSRLRQGHVWDLFNHLQATRIEEGIERIAEHLVRLEDRVRRVEADTSALQALEHFKAMKLSLSER